MIHLVLLSGGSGSRLWPLSNSARSKQFLKVLKDPQGESCSMAQRVFGQINNIPAELDITIATCANQECSIRSQLFGSFSLVLEPERRDTAPAVMLACAHLDKVQKADLCDTVVVMPIDTFAEQRYYDTVELLDKAVQSDCADIVLMGVEPTEPSEKFGYIIPQRETGDFYYAVKEFKEKPTVQIAQDYIQQGALWNCGVFAFKLGYLRGLTSQYLTEPSYDAFVSSYGSLPKISFDYEVVEKAQSVAVVPYAGVWKDLGTWNSLSEEMSDLAHGRVSLSDSTNVHVVNETGLPLLVSGLHDSVVVATYDGILVCSKEASTQIKGQVASISETRPMYEKRLWGEYRVIDQQEYPGGKNALTKELIVSAGRQLSYQRHRNRSEVWTIVAGEGTVVLDGKEIAVFPGVVIDISPMQMHAVKALSDLHIIEVQFGGPLIEEDIERFGYYWD